MIISGSLFGAGLCIPGEGYTFDVADKQLSRVAREPRVTRQVESGLAHVTVVFCK